jgi:branched-chain amino acid transport system substrate-binding protein
MKSYMPILGAIATGALFIGTPAQAFDCKGGAINVGFAKAQTGFFAFFDNVGAQGAMVAIDQINKNGGIDGCPIKGLRKDTQSNPALARQVAEDLIRDGASIIIAPADFDIGVGASQAAQDAGKFAISFEASSSAWTGAVGPNFFTAAITEDDQGRAMAAYAIQKKWDTTYIVTNGAFNIFTATEKAFLKYYPGTAVGRDTVADDATDYAPVVSKIRAAGDKVQFIFLNDYFPHVGTFIKQLRAAGVNLPVLGNQNYSTRALPQTVGATGLKDVAYIAQGFYEGSSASAQARDFTSSYEKLFGTFPENANSLAGYEGMLVLADGLKKAGSTDAAAITAAISAQKNFAQPTSEIYSWINRHPSRSAAAIGFDEAANFIELARIDPRSVPAKK